MNKQRGNTRPQQGETGVQARVPRQPHELDESADSQATANASHAAIGKKATQDTRRGVRDTTKGDELGRTYGRLREGEETDEDKPRR
jgi:hypothetical protein